MTRKSKIRLGWLSVLAVFYAGVALGQSLDAGLPSVQIGGNISSRPQAQGSGGEPVRAATDSRAQGDLPSVQVNSDVIEDAGSIVESERGASAPASTASRLHTSIAGRSATHRESYRDRYANIHLMNSPRSSHESRAAGAPQRISGRARADIEHRIVGSEVAASDAVDATSQGSFPDSTRMATFASPPDPGTESPLAWTPGLSLGLRDTQTTPFLNPNFHAQRRRRYRRSPLGRNRALGEAPAGVTSIDRDLNPERQLQDTLSQPAQPSPLSTLDQQANPDIDQ